MSIPDCLRKRRGLTAALLVLTGCIGSLHAENPSSPDPVRQAVGALFDGIHESTLPNGLRVVLKPIPDAATVTVMTAYRVGSADEPLDQTGLAHYLEHLMFKGTRQLMPGDIDRLTRKAGGRNNAYTTQDYTTYHFDFASAHWDTALRIEADRMRHLQIDDRHEFQQEKGAVIAELDGNEDSPYDLENKTILPLLFGDKSPYGHPVIGEKNHVRNVTAEQIKAFYDRWYHPNNATIVMVGGFDPAKALGLIRELFGPIPASQLPPRPSAEIVQRDQPIRVEIPSRFETERLVMGFNTCRQGDADDDVLDVIEALLTGGKTGRLYRSLVLEKQVAAEVLCANQTGMRSGWFSIEMEVRRGIDRMKAEQALLDELERLTREPVTEAELHRVERNVIAGMIFSLEDPHALADSIAEAVSTVGLDSLRGYLARIKAVTPADIQRVAQKYLQPQRRVVVASVLPKDEELLRPLAARHRGNGGRTRLPSISMKAPRQGRFGSTLPKGSPSGSTSAQPGLDLTATRRVTLENGLKLLLLPRRRLPIVFAQAHVARVRFHESAENAGMTALIGMLLEEGTTRRTEQQISQAIEDVGGFLSMSGNGGSVKVLSPDRRLGLDLLIDCLTRPAFHDDAVRRVKEHQLAEIEDRRVNPEARAKDELLKIIYGEHPLSRPVLGTSATVEKLDAAACRQFHQQLFVPNNTVLAIVGDFDPDEMIELVRQLTRDWHKRDLPRLDLPPLMPTTAQSKILSLPKSSQLNIYLGHLGIRRRDEDYHRLLVMDNILGVGGAGFTDRLSARLRDRQGLAYTVNASITASAGEEPGVFAAFIGTHPNQLATVTQILKEEIRRIRDEKPSPREVEEAKDYLAATIGFDLATGDTVAAQLIQIERFELGYDYVDRFRRAIAAVTPEDVQAAAQRHLRPERLVQIAAGPVSDTGEPLPRDRP